MKVEEATPTSDIQRQILASVYNTIGLFYVIAQQGIRAVNSFQKAYDIKNDDYDSLLQPGKRRRKETDAVFSTFRHNSKCQHSDEILYTYVKPKKKKYTISLRDSHLKSLPKKMGA